MKIPQKILEADMYLNIRYADKKLELISSFSPKTFLLERDILHVFDTYVKDMFKKINITLVESGSDNEGIRQSLRCILRI